MKSSEVLNKVRSLLGVELEKVELAQAKLDNGTVVEAESFEAGNEIFIVTDDQKVLLPVGDYVMEDGRKLVVSEEGIIGEIVSVEAEYEDKEKEEMEEEVVVEAPEEVVEEVEKIVEAVVEAVAPVIEEVKEEVQELKRKFEEQSEKKDEKKKEEMSKAARRPIKHNPEKKAQPQGYKFATKRQMNTRDRVLEKIFNI